MSTAAKQRLIRDYGRICNEKSEHYVAHPTEDDIMTWHALIVGPENSIWEGATLDLILKFPPDYPNKPPSVAFRRAIFHPNVYADGKICLDTLQRAWSPVYDVIGVLVSIQSLLTDPNPNSPANQVAAKLYVDDIEEYNNRVRKCVEESWEMEEIDVWSSKVLLND